MHLRVSARLRNGSRRRGRREQKLSQNDPAVSTKASYVAIEVARF